MRHIHPTPATILRAIFQETDLYISHDQWCAIMTRACEMDADVIRQPEPKQQYLEAAE